MNNVLRLKSKAGHEAAEEAVKFMAAVGDTWMVRVDSDGYYRLLRNASPAALIAAKYPVRIIGPYNGRASATDLADDMRESRKTSLVSYKAKERKPRKENKSIIERRERMGRLSAETATLVAKAPMTVEQISDAIGRPYKYVGELVRYMVKNGALVRVRALRASERGGVRYSYGLAA
jgi:hypothetical protein